MLDDLGKLLFEGSSTAWLCIGLMMGIFALSIFLFFFWRKIPKPARTMIVNNFRGQNAIVADSYPDQFSRLETPQMFATGMFYENKRGWHFPPLLSHDDSEKLENEVGNPAHDIFTKAFVVGGTSSAFYYAYSMKGVVINPELHTVIEHYRTLEKMNPKSENDAQHVVRVPKQHLIDALQKMKAQDIVIDPVWITFFNDPRKIKEYIPKAFSKARLVNIELEVKRWMASHLPGGDGNKLVLLLGIIGIFLSVLILLKQFGFIGR